MADWWLGEEAVGELISRTRDRLGKSQYTLAEALREVSGRSDGVPDRSMVARWETGRRIPTARQLRQEFRQPRRPDPASDLTRDLAEYDRAFGLITADSEIT